jgi:TonB family protein
MRPEIYGMQVARHIRNYYAPRANVCFDHETRNRREVRGTVVIGFDIQADGRVTNARPVRNTTGIERLGQCLARTVGNWELPRPPTPPLSMELPFSR